MNGEALINFSDPAQKGRFLTYARSLAGAYRVAIKRLRKRRSDAQNKFYWGVVVPHVAAGIVEAWGEELTDDQIHFFLKNRFLSVPVIDHNTGEEKGTTERTSSAKLTTVEFMAYIERISLFAAESLNVAIPEPNAADFDDAPTAHAGASPARRN